MPSTSLRPRARVTLSLVSLFASSARSTLKVDRLSSYRTHGDFERASDGGVWFPALVAPAFADLEADSFGRGRRGARASEGVEQR